MIDPANFYKELSKNNIDFFTGVPDSLLKNFCAYVEDNVGDNQHIIAANEGNAIGLAAGYHMATEKIPLVYLQNSGLGNCINPLTSLADQEVYSIPLLLLIGWRGEPGIQDEPQHIKQGRITQEQLELLGIDYLVMDADSDISELIFNCLKKIKINKSPVAILVKKNSFSKYLLKQNKQKASNFTREQAIKVIVELSNDDDIFISTTGKCSRELYEIRTQRGEAQKDFLTVGSMGHTSSIALGVALSVKDRNIICLDGDGSILMHLGALPVISSVAPKNLLHVILNNGCHESVGGQPTVINKVDLRKLSYAFDYANYFEAHNSQELIENWKEISCSEGPSLLHININSSSREDLSRPKTTALANKHEFMQSIKDG
mgnify:CR=1 FL=1|tara:strand:+ start:1890 stop:3014 length:1125 start_codon:yes stop_codon:yes gene_type:complete